MEKQARKKVMMHCRLGVPCAMFIEERIMVMDKQVSKEPCLGTSLPKDACHDVLVVGYIREI